MGLEDVPSQEELDDYRHAMRAWFAANMPPLDPDADPQHLFTNQDADRLRYLQRTLHDGGYAGICFPTELGGQGLSRAHNRIFLEESAAYEIPAHVGVPGLSIIAPPIMEFGTPEQKEHVRRMITGEEIFVQMMSEPGGGSDMAGALTRADRDGDSWILNGSKIWSSGAWRSDWGLALVRTNWEVPKHRGLSMFLLDLRLPGITVNRIKMTNGTDEFCQEYFDNVAIPHSCLLGQPNDGWTVANRLLFHERDATGGGSPYIMRSQRVPAGNSATMRLVRLAQRHGVDGDLRVRELVGESLAIDAVSRQLIERVGTGMRMGVFPQVAGSLLRLNGGQASVRRNTIAVQIAGRGAVTWDDDANPEPGEEFISRQATCIGGGTTEMQRNLVSERVLGMPREHAADKDAPFGEVRHN